MANFSNRRASLVEEMHRLFLLEVRLEYFSKRFGAPNEHTYRHEAVMTLAAAIQGNDEDAWSTALVHWRRGVTYHLLCLLEAPAQEKLRRADGMRNKGRKWRTQWETVARIARQYTNPLEADREADKYLIGAGVRSRRTREAIRSAHGLGKHLQKRKRV